MRLLLSEERIFPVTKDENGKLLNTSPNTGISVPGTVQGEGMLTGTPSLFVRLAGCNLRCIWDKGNSEYSICDTPHSVFGKVRSKAVETGDVASIIKNNLGNIKHVVITGGEPVLQANPLSLLCKKLKEDLNVHLTLETNGTVFNKELAEHIDLFSISPKLAGTNPVAEKLKKYGLQETDIHRAHDAKRINIKVLQEYIDFSKKHKKDFQLKFVVTKKAERDEIKHDFLEKLKEWSISNIFIMPLGATKDELKQFTPAALKMAIENGWRFSPRLHIELFNSSTGV